MTVAIPLGTISQVDDLRTVWKHEALDFTPWVAENIELVNEATGLSLEVVEEESSVGSFSVDILAQDSSNGAYAVIENQLEETNHDHLGKLLTYASGKEAKYIIWIVKSAREEHRAAIEWLNSKTVDGVGFFLLEIQLWKIDESNIAPRLNIVEQPNDWVKMTKQSSSTQGGAASKFKYTYWSEFNDYAFQKEEFAKTFKKHKASSDHWYGLSIGSSEASISLLINTKSNIITMELNVHDNKQLFDKLLENKEEIEKFVGSELDWRRMNDKKSSRILLEQNVDLSKQEQHHSQFDWFIEYAFRFKNAFGKYL